MTVTWPKAIALAIIAAMFAAAAIIAGLCTGGDDHDPSDRPGYRAPSWSEYTRRTTQDCPTASERAWLADVRDGTAPLEGTLGNLADLVERAGANLALFSNNRWREDLIAELVSLKLVIDQVRALDAPPSVRTGELDHTLDQLAWELEYLIENMVAAVDDLDLRKLDAATSSVITLDGLVQLATIQIDNLCD